MQFELSTSANPMTCSNGASMHQQPKSLTDIIRQSVRVMSANNKTCTKIAAAMYVEQNNKVKRANSFIVSGLQGNDSTYDLILVKNLCRDESRLPVDILSTERIGKEIEYFTF